MIKQILEQILDGRDPECLSCKEAKRVVSDFYFKVESLTFGQKSKQHIDFVCRSVLESHGLGYFAV